MPHRTDRGDLPSDPTGGHGAGPSGSGGGGSGGGRDVGDLTNAELIELGQGTDADFFAARDEWVRRGGTRETYLDALEGRREEINREETGALPGGDTVGGAGDNRTAEQIRDDLLVSGGGQALSSFEDEQEFDPFQRQEEVDPRGVFTRFLNEQLGTASSFLRGGAESQFGNLFNQFNTRQLGGLAGLGENVQPGEPGIFGDFLRGQGPAGTDESNLSTALRNISGVFGGEGLTPGGVTVNDFFRGDQGITNAGRVGGAIGSNLLGSISPFLRSSFQGGIGDQLRRLLASNPDANPFAAFQQGGFF